LPHMPQYVIGQELDMEQDWHCTYNVTLWRGRVTIVAVDSQ